MSFDDWIFAHNEKKSTVEVWLLTHKYDELIFTFIKSLRERKLWGLLCTSRHKLDGLTMQLINKSVQGRFPGLLETLKFSPNNQKEFEAGHWH